jgi:VWFA-related protein
MMRYTVPFLAFMAALSAQQKTVIQTESRVVLVDAIVTAKKNVYVGDLEARNFRVFEDGKEQELKSFSFEGASSTRIQPRYLVLFFDSAGIEAGDRFLVQQAVSNFIDANAGPNRMMSVVSYNGQLRVAQKFTDNAGRLKDSLKAISTGSVRGAASAATDLRARDMVRSIGELSKSLSPLPGRKIVILLTGALPSTAEEKIAMADTLDAANRSGVAIYPIDVRPLDGPRAIVDNSDSTGANPRASRTTGRGAMRGPQGDTAAAGEAGAQGGEDILFGLANGTGGFVIQNSSVLLAGLQSIGEEQDQYYVLSYTPPESKDGTCHTLRVRVDRKGTSVRARRNYCTQPPLDLLVGTSTGKDLETRAAGTQTGNIAATMQLPYFYISPTVARVNVAMEIMPETLKFENQKGRLHAEINLLGIASTPDGGVAARFSDAVKFDFDSQNQLDKVKGKPLHYEKEFKIAPGQYNFALVVSSGAASFGKLETPLVIDARKEGTLAMSAVTLSREVHPPTDLGLGLDASLSGDRTPLVAQGIQVIPSGSSQLTKSEPAYFYFEVYDSNPVAAQVRIFDRKTNDTKWSSGLMPLPSSQQGGTIPLNTLAPGSYVLEVIAVDSTEVRIKRTKDFEVK